MLDISLILIGRTCHVLVRINLGTMSSIVNVVMKCDAPMSSHNQILEFFGKIFVKVIGAQFCCS